MKTVLVIEDEAAVRDLICHHLAREGFRPQGCRDAESAYRLLQGDLPDAIVLDLMLPGMQGLEFCRMLRAKERTAGIPVIIVTAKEDELDKLLGFELGADDYLTKPFSPRELVARLRAVLRRSSGAGSSLHPRCFERDGLFVDFAGHQVKVRGKEVRLTATEFRLLRHFISHPEIVFSRDELLDAVWGPQTFVLPRTVDVHIQRLRSLIEEDPSRPAFIVTVRGAGYKFRSGSQ